MAQSTAATLNKSSPSHQSRPFSGFDSSEGIVAKNKAGDPEQVYRHPDHHRYQHEKNCAARSRLKLLPRKTRRDRGELPGRAAAVKMSMLGDETTADQANASDEGNSSDGDGENNDTSEADSNPGIPDSERWMAADDIPEDIVDQATPVEFTALSSEKPQDHLHSFRIRVEKGRGALSFTCARGFAHPEITRLVDDYDKVLLVPQPAA